MSRCTDEPGVARSDAAGVDARLSPQPLLPRLASVAVIYFVEDGLDPLEVLLQSGALQRGQALLLEEGSAFIRGSCPRRSMRDSDAGIRATYRLAKCWQRRSAVDVRHLLQAHRCAGIEEAVGEHTDVQGPCEAGEHRAQPCAICKHGRKRAQFRRCEV